VLEASALVVGVALLGLSIPITFRTCSNIRSNRLRAPKAAIPLSSRAESSRLTSSCHGNPSKHAVYLCNLRDLNQAGMSSNISGVKSSIRGDAVLFGVSTPLLLSPALCNPALFRPLANAMFRKLPLSALPGYFALVGVRQFFGFSQIRRLFWLRLALCLWRG